MVETAVHEMRHVYQALDPKWIARSTEMAEQDARLFVYEFFGSHSISDDAATLERTLNQILKDDLDRLWIEARSRARAALVKPARIESTDLQKLYREAYYATLREMEKRKPKPRVDDFATFYHYGS